MIVSIRFPSKQLERRPHHRIPIQGPMYFYRNPNLASYDSCASGGRVVQAGAHLKFKRHDWDSVSIDWLVGRLDPRAIGL